MNIKNIINFWNKLKKNNDSISNKKIINEKNIIFYIIKKFIETKDIDNIINKLILLNNKKRNKNENNNRFNK